MHCSSAGYIEECVTAVHGLTSHSFLRIYETLRTDKIFKILLSTVTGLECYGILLVRVKFRLTFRTKVERSAGINKEYYNIVINRTQIVNTGMLLEHSFTICLYLQSKMVARVPIGDWLSQ